MQACTRPRSFLAAWHDVFWIPRWLIHPSQNGSRLPGESRLRFRTGSKQYKMVVVEKNETHWFIQFTLHITQKKMLHLKPTWFAQFFYSTYVILVLSMKPMEPICFGEHPSLIYPHIQTWESLIINTLSYSLSALWNKIPMKKHTMYIDVYSGFWWSHQLTSALGLYPQFQAEYRSFFLPVTITKGHLWVLEISLCQSTKCGKDNPPAGCKKKIPCPAFWRHFPAACSWMFDVTRCYYTHHISHHISYTFKFDQPLPAISFLRLDFSRPASLKTFSSSVSEFSVMSTKAFSRRSLWWRSLLSKSPEEIKKYWHKFEDV